MSPSKARRSAARVEAIIARNAAVAVIFRRGPSRRVRMLKWNLRSDRIEEGQWIEAGVPVTRCDLSPNGELVACFVASYRRRPGTWTAISRPPFFTALAVWPISATRISISTNPRVTSSGMPEVRVGMSVPAGRLQPWQQSLSLGC